jgi:hypothetical protein
MTYALCFGSADFVRLLHQLAELRLQNRSEHDHPVAEAELACTMVLPSPGTTRCFSNPKVWHNHSIAAGALRYRRHGITVALVFFARLDMIISLLI